MKTIYTDGSCKGNPGPGGWAVIVVEDSRIVKKLGGFEKMTTNNRMELLAGIEALRLVQDGESAVIFTDSTYLKLGITQWLPNWKQKNWKTANKKSVKNQDLWQVLDQFAMANQLNHSRIQWWYITGHSGNIYNELCDEIAKKIIASEGKEIDLLH